MSRRVQFHSDEARELKKVPEGYIACSHRLYPGLYVSHLHPGPADRLGPRVCGRYSADGWDRLLRNRVGGKGICLACLDRLRSSKDSDAAKALQKIQKFTDEVPVSVLKVVGLVIEDHRGHTVARFGNTAGEFEAERNRAKAIMALIQLHGPLFDLVKACQRYNRHRLDSQIKAALNSVEYQLVAVASKLGEPEDHANP